jgi:hypothetical protein
VCECIYVCLNVHMQAVADKEKLERAEEEAKRMETLKAAEDAANAIEEAAALLKKQEETAALLIVELKKQHAVAKDELKSAYYTKEEKVFDSLQLTLKHLGKKARQHYKTPHEIYTDRNPMWATVTLDTLAEVGADKDTQGVLNEAQIVIIDLRQHLSPGLADVVVAYCVDGIKLLHNKQKLCFIHRSTSTISVVGAVHMANTQHRATTDEALDPPWRYEGAYTMLASVQSVHSHKHAPVLHYKVKAFHIYLHNELHTIAHTLGHA